MVNSYVLLSEAALRIVTNVGRILLNFIFQAHSDQTLLRMERLRIPTD